MHNTKRNQKVRRVPMRTSSSDTATNLGILGGACGIILAAFLCKAVVIGGVVALGIVLWKWLS